MGNNATGGITRTLIAAGMAYAVGKGWITEGMSNELIGAVTTLVVALWSVFSKKIA